MGTTDLQHSGRIRLVTWSAWVVACLLLLEVASGAAYLAVIALLGSGVALIPGVLPHRQARRDASELGVIAGLYVVVVALMSLAFRGFGTDSIPGLFLSFAAALLVGVVGPLYYVVWRRGGTLGDVGLRFGRWRQTASLALVFAAVQFWLTLRIVDLPSYESWVPLFVMALVVGMFEAVFFRGFVQTRLEEQFGQVAGVALAAALYGLYHVGYGMGASEMLFLTGLGLVYAVAFAIPRSIWVLWPLLTPLGSFYNNVTTGDIELPWASIIGFGEVFAVMLFAMWLAHRHVCRVPMTSGLRSEVPSMRSAGL